MRSFRNPSSERVNYNNLAQNFRKVNLPKILSKSPQRIRQMKFTQVLFSKLFGEVIFLEKMRKIYGALFLKYKTLMWFKVKKS